MVRIEPWTTPLPAHVLERLVPLRGEDIPLVRPYAPLDDTLRLRAVQQPRRRVLVQTGSALELSCVPLTYGADL
ncbi:hypothetical protein ACWEFL_16665 [Streptomyces sp. NPDC004838]